jgi:hypothetical protein
MIVAFIKAVIGISVILGGWLAVQRAWRCATGTSPDEDALTGRLGCQGCDCGSQCEGTDSPNDENTEKGSGIV